MVAALFLPALLCPPLFDLPQAFLHARFGTLRCGNVVFPPLQCVWKALHGGELVLCVVGVLIPFAVVQVLHQAGGGVADL